MASGYDYFREEREIIEEMKRRDYENNVYNYYWKRCSECGYKKQIKWSKSDLNPDDICNDCNRRK